MTDINKEIFVIIKKHGVSSSFEISNILDIKESIVKKKLRFLEAKHELSVFEVSQKRKVFFLNELNEDIRNLIESKYEMKNKYYNSFSLKGGNFER